MYKLVQWQYAGECASCKPLFQDVHRQCAKLCNECASCILLISQTWKLPWKLSSFHKWFPTCALRVYTLAHHLSTYMHNVVSKLCTTPIRAVAVSINLNNRMHDIMHKAYLCMVYIGGSMFIQIHASILITKLQRVPRALYASCKIHKAFQR